MDHMQGMMSGMSMGMMIGLIGGLLFGDIYRGDLFYSTMLGMFVGGASGFIIGIPLSILSIVEGTLSGIMGGMMGAMLGEMVPTEKIEALLFFFIMLLTACMLLLTRLIETEKKETSTTRWHLIFLHPATPAVLLIGIFLWFQTLAFAPSTSDLPSQHSTILGNNLVKEVNFTAVDFSYQPSQVMIKKNIPIKVTFQNDGTVEHNIEIVSNGKIMIVSESIKGHQHSEKVQLHAKSGESAESVWEATEEGTYQYYCTIPGHKESGMIGNLIVM